MSIKEEIKYFCLGGIVTASLIVIVGVIGVGVLYIASWSESPFVILGVTIISGLTTLFYFEGKSIKKEGFWKRFPINYRGKKR